MFSVFRTSSSNRILTLQTGYSHVDRNSQNPDKMATANEIANAQRASKHNLNSGFFRLPLELREQIYEYVFDREDSFSLQYKTLCIVLTNDGYPFRYSDPVNYGLPTWMLASRSIVPEAIAILYRT
jgi:hypothetical protein